MRGFQKRKILSLGISFWILLIVFIFILLFPPQEFWMVMDKLKFTEILRDVRPLIVHFFYDYIANY